MLCKTYFIMNWKFSFVFISRIVPRLLMKIVLEYLGNTFRPFSHLKSLRILTLTFFLHISCFPMVKARRIVRGDAQKRPLRWSKNTAGTGRRKGSLPRFELGFFWFHLNRMGPGPGWVFFFAAMDEGVGNNILGEFQWVQKKSHHFFSWHV